MNFELNQKLKKSPWLILVLCVVAVTLGGFLSDIALAKTAKEIDASVDASLERFYKQVKGAKEFTTAAKAMLVLPSVKKAAFVVGGEYGEGALRVGGKSIDYYNMVSGSFGFQIGAEAKDIVIAFMTNEALAQFQKSKGWEAGVDGNLALVKIGAGRRLDTTTIKDPIVAFVFDVKGLMADISLKGAKFNRLHKAEYTSQILGGSQA